MFGGGGARQKVENRRPRGQRQANGQQHAVAWFFGDGADEVLMYLDLQPFFNRIAGCGARNNGNFLWIRVSKFESFLAAKKIDSF